MIGGFGVIGSDGASPLGGIAYGRRAHDLCRFVADAADHAVATVVRAGARVQGKQRDDLRSRLDRHDCYTLLTFARRRAASSLRDGDLGEALEAVEALTFVSSPKIDYRDMSVDFPLYAIGRLGGDPADTAVLAAARSEPGIADSFTAAAGRTAHLSLTSCALLEVSSRYGLGFLDTWARPYAPQSDLAGMAICLADAIDAGARYSVDELHLSSLPGVWFGRPRSPPLDIPVSGCVLVSATTSGGSRWGAGLVAFLAEVESADLASSLAAEAKAASTASRPRAAESEGRLLLVILGGSSTRGQESRETNGSLEQLLETLLRRMRS